VRGLFLIGTDTGVGKTAVGQGLLRLAHRRGFRLVPYKPAETDWQATTSDAQRLLDAAALPGLTIADVCPFPFPDAVAPSVAARLSGRPLSTSILVAHGEAQAARGDALLIEAAGGLLTPYGPGLTSASLAYHFGIDILVVAANRLGTINHTALTLAELSRRALRLAGFVLVDVNPLPGPDHATNAAEIATLTGVFPLGVLRHSQSLDADSLADAVAQDLDLSTVLDGALA